MSTEEELTIRTIQRLSRGECPVDGEKLNSETHGPQPCQLPVKAPSVPAAAAESLAPVSATTQPAEGAAVAGEQRNNCEHFPHVLNGLRPSTHKPFSVCLQCGDTGEPQERSDQGFGNIKWAGDPFHPVGEYSIWRRQEMRHEAALSAERERIADRLMVGAAYFANYHDPDSRVTQDAVKWLTDAAASLRASTAPAPAPARCAKVMYANGDLCGHYEDEHYEPGMYDHDFVPPPAPEAAPAAAVPVSKLRALVERLRTYYLEMPGGGLSPDAYEAQNAAFNQCAAELEALYAPEASGDAEGGDADVSAE